MTDLSWQDDGSFCLWQPGVETMGGLFLAKKMRTYGSGFPFLLPEASNIG
jgi:hypothetical protein